jgi:hypothetical protein
MGGIGREDGDCHTLVLISFLLMILPLTGTAFGKGIDRGLVRIGVSFAFLGVFVERHIQAIVRFRDVLLQMLAYAP